MEIKCQKCGFTETTNKELIVKVLGAAMPAFGFWAWVSFLFAGTGFAMAICIAIIAGGPALLIYKDEIVQWLAGKGYRCPKCGCEHWDAVNEKTAISNNVASTNEKATTPSVTIKSKPKPKIKIIDTSLPFTYNDDDITDLKELEHLYNLGKINTGAAENRVAQIYYSGINTNKNYSKCFYWSNISAQKGNKDAQFRLSNLYRNGWGVTCCEELAKIWLSTSRE